MCLVLASSSYLIAAAAVVAAIEIVVDVVVAFFDLTLWMHFVAALCWTVVVGVVAAVAADTLLMAT